MFKIIKYTSLDLVRSRWVYFYAAFYSVLTMSLFLLNSDLSKTIITLMNIVLFLVPLVATIFGMMYYYHNRDFTEHLLAQPIPRTHIFLGQYIGIAGSLAFCLLVGLGIPFMAYGILQSSEIWNYVMLLVTGIFLSAIFSAVSYWIAMSFENRLMGFGLAIFVWLLFAIVYDGLLLLALVSYSDYPLENVALIASFFNPIDLSRILILLQLDMAALMGYTGAVFQKFLGGNGGFAAALAALSMWICVISWFIHRKGLTKDF